MTPTPKPAKSQAELDKEAATAAAVALAEKNAAKAKAEPAKTPETPPAPAEKPSEPAEALKHNGPEPTAEEKAAAELAAAEATPPETVDDDLVDQLDNEFGFTTGETDEVAIEYRGGAARVKKLTDLLEGKKDNFTIYGYGGAIITLGDLRALLGPYSLDHSE